MRRVARGLEGESVHVDNYFKRFCCERVYGDMNQS